MWSGSPYPRWGARPRLFPVSPLVRFVSRLSHPLLPDPTVFLYLGRPIDMQGVQSLRVLPPQHSKQADLPDRKSTRLNSSHVRISYAVFCLTKNNSNQH